MIIEFGNELDYDFILRNDHHIKQELVMGKLQRYEIIVVRMDNQIIGHLRYGYFWDNIPFMNMLFLKEGYRSQGIGRELVTFWEQKMRGDGFNIVMTSTLANEQAQHFYRKLGYVDSGSLLLEKEPLEIIFVKKI